MLLFKFAGPALKYIEPPSKLFPIHVPVFIDKRASARGVDDLVREITGANPNAYVICNGVKGNDRALTYQRAKGANHLSDRDIYVVVTHLNPDHYARLNVVGQWLDIPDVVDLYYLDQISQAVGRNKGVRDTGEGRKTVVIASSRMARMSLFASSAPVVTEPGPDEPPEGESELKAASRRSAELLMADNEFSPRRARRDHMAFKPTKSRPW